MALTTVFFQAPSRLVALDLAHRFRARGWTVEVAGPATSDRGRVVRVTVPSSDLDDLEAVVDATSSDVVALDGAGPPGAGPAWRDADGTGPGTLMESAAGPEE